MTLIIIACVGFVLFVVLIGWVAILIATRQGHTRVWVRWRNAFVGVLVVVFVMIIGIFVWSYVSAIPLNETASVPSSELAKGKVVDLRLAEGSGNPCSYEDEFPLTGLCIGYSRRLDPRGQTVRISTSQEGVSLGLGESEQMDGLGVVTLVAFEDLDGFQGARLLVVPDSSSTWLVVRDAGVPQSELDEGRVVDVRFDECAYVDALSMCVSARFADSKYYAGLDTGTVSVKFSRDFPLDDVSVSLCLGESERVEGVGVVTLVAFENIDWEQGFKLLIVPESTGANADVDNGAGSGVRDDG
jgi:hypothetical protein